jgi:hypothetical protein
MVRKNLPLPWLHPPTVRHFYLFHFYPRLRYCFSLLFPFTRTVRTHDWPLAILPPPPHREKRIPPSVRGSERHSPHPRRRLRSPAVGTIGSARSRILPPRRTARGRFTVRQRLRAPSPAPAPPPPPSRFPSVVPPIHDAHPIQITLPATSSSARRPRRRSRASNRSRRALRPSGRPPSLRDTSSTPHLPRCSHLPRISWQPSASPWPSPTCCRTTTSL